MSIREEMSFRQMLTNWYRDKMADILEPAWS